MPDRAERALDVGLQHDPQLGDLAVLDLGADLLERAGRPALAARSGDLGRLGRVPCGLLVGDHAQGVARLRKSLETDDLHGGRRLGRLHALAGGVVQRSNAAVGPSDAHDVADLQRAGLDEHGRDVAAALVDLRLDDRADRVAVRVGLEVLEVGDEQDHLHQVVDPGSLLRADRHGDDVAAVLLDEHAVVGQLLLDPVGLGIGLVDLVDGHDHRHLGGANVVDRLLGLRHDAVVGGDDDDRDVGHLGAARAHGGERLVAGRVEEDDPLAVVDRPRWRRCAA